MHVFTRWIVSSSDYLLFVWRDAFRDCQSLKATTKHVLLTIATHMTKDGENSHPSIEQLIYETGLSNRTICTHIRLASEAGWLKVKKHGSAGQAWANHAYQPIVPEGHNRVTHKQSKELKGGEGVSPPSSEKVVNLTTDGNEPDAEDSEHKGRNAVKEVHSSGSGSSPNSSSISMGVH